MDMVAQKKSSKPNLRQQEKLPSGENPILRGLRALSEEVRLRIIHILSYADLNVSEICTILGLPQSTVSRHLRILTDTGILSFHREGSLVYYGYSTGKTSFSEALLQFILSQKKDIPNEEKDLEALRSVLAVRTNRRAAYFDKMGKEYDIIQEEVLDSRLYRNKIVLSLPKKSGLILDLGCGPGGLIPYLLPKCEKVIGIDSSPKMIEICRKEFKKSKNTEFIQSNLENLPLGQNVADSCVASMVLHHLSSPEKALKEIHKVLRPGGSLIIVDLLKHKMEYMREKYEDLWMGFEPEIMKSWLHSCGFMVSEEEILPTRQTNFKVLFIKAKKKED